MLNTSPEYFDGKWYLGCSKCNSLVIVSDKTVTKVSCSRCTYITCYNFLSDSEKEQLNSKSAKIIKKPVGWHFMKEYVDSEGNVYHKGKEQPDLKGTLKPTKIKAKKRKPRKTKLEKLKEELTDYQLKKQTEQTKTKSKKK